MDTKLPVRFFSSLQKERLFPGRSAFRLGHLNKFFNSFALNARQVALAIGKYLAGPGKKEERKNKCR
jgi:hypothetical protein